MQSILISWIARNNDFHRLSADPNSALHKRLGKAKEEGPTLQFHRHFYKEGNYAQHVLLYASPEDETAVEHLASEIRRQHRGRDVQAELLEVTDVINLEQIKTRVETRLLAFAPDQPITIFFSPGTSIMQLAWFICHNTLGRPTRLVQTRDGRHSADGVPELMELKIEQSATPMSAIIREAQVAARTDSPHELFALSDSMPPSLEALSGFSPLKKKGAKAPVSADVVDGFLPLPSLQAVYHRCRQVAHTDRVTVLVRGESGTGKEHLARTVHNESSRRSAPFVALNCAALTDTVLESRLFGYQKGAFTGAEQNTKGLFELADGGTIFLDEIGDISSALQTALLRVLQAGEIQPLGGTPRRVNVRVVAATHADLEECCQQGRFRWDLYYRLAVAELELPALRERPVAEREQLLEFFIESKQVSLRQSAPLRLSAAARQQMLSYLFPGNVREMENLIETLYVFQRPDIPVQLTDLPRRMRSSGTATGHSQRLADVSRLHIVRVVGQCQGVKRQAAMLLDLDERVVAKALREHAALQVDQGPKAGTTTA